MKTLVNIKNIKSIKNIKKLYKDTKLLNKSIRHWERLRDDRARPGEVPYARSCALCGEYMEPWRKVAQPYMRCIGCPVHNTTGCIDCTATPYLYARDSIKYGIVDRQSACQEEVDFLISVRDNLSFAHRFISWIRRSF